MKSLLIPDEWIVWAMREARDETAQCTTPPYKVGYFIG
jgi:hypothetical protein